MTHILLTQEGCEPCTRAKEMLDKAKVRYVEKDAKTAMQDGTLGKGVVSVTPTLLTKYGELIETSEEIKKWVNSKEK